MLACTSTFHLTHSHSIFASVNYTGMKKHVTAWIYFFATVIYSTHVSASSLPPSWPVGSDWVRRQCPPPPFQRLQSPGYDLRRTQQRIDYQQSRTKAEACRHITCTLDAPASSSVTLPVSWMSPWSPTQTKHQSANPYCTSQISL